MARKRAGSWASGHRLTARDVGRVYTLIRGGATQQAVAQQLACCRKTVQGVLAQTGGLPPRPWQRTERRLSAAERETIFGALQRGRSCAAIAHQLQRAPSTISREVRANGGRERYRGRAAEYRAQHQAQRPKPSKLARSPALRAWVIAGLTRRWSPQQIAQRLRTTFPGDPTMQVSHETIYQSLYIQTRGALRRELTGYLRTRRTRRHPQQRGVTRGLRDMVSIAARPAEVADRAVPGHWEGDLLLGRAAQSAIATLVERSSRYVLLVALPHGRTADVVQQALAACMRRLPAELRGSLTWDQGKEMAQHLRFTLATKMAVYFCDPHSPWQRGSNENTNGLLRQYLPRTMDLRPVSQHRLDVIARELNGRPRQTLGWKTPAETLTERLTRTATSQRALTD
ncbi:MAG: IS30 family transposase [Gemmatimonadales bacterium]